MYEFLFSYRVGERTILQIVLFSFVFSVFIFSVPSKVIIIAIQLMFLGINIFLVLLVAHFDPRPAARAKMGPSWAQSIVMPANVNKLLFY